MTSTVMIFWKKSSVFPPTDPIRDETQLDGDVVLVGGALGEVIVRVGGSKVSIAVYSVRWEGPHTPVVRPKQLATLNWKRLPASSTMVMLHGLITAAIELRRAKYRKCEKCGETKPPEWMHGEKICQSCAEQHLGVVY
ncbi:MAG: hypothetical protein WD049_04435 [Candidatus Paceibacterota bacterium]